MESNFIIDNLLSRNESERLSFKTNLDLDPIAREVTAMINTNGGDILVGVNKDKQVVGIENNNDIIDYLQTFLRKNISPIAPVSFKKIIYKGKKILLISVWEGGTKPYSFQNIIYNREGKRTFVSRGDRMVRLIENRRNTDLNWERKGLLGVEYEDLDHVEVEKTKDAYLEYATTDVIRDGEDFLVNRGLIVNGNITNSCMVLFGNNPGRYIPQSVIRLTVYSGDNKEGSFIEDKFYDSHLFGNIRHLLGYLDNLYGKEIKIEGVLRTENKKYPEVALREGLMNAAIHRDYNASEGFLKVSVYYNKTVISNFGSLPRGVRIEDLTSEHNSILRNPDLAHMCFYRKLIEMLGTGTLRMIKDCRDNGFKDPFWEEANNVLQLTFPGLGHGRGEGVNEGVNEGVDNKNEGVSEGVAEGVNEGVKLNIEGVSKGLNSELERLCTIIATTPGKRANDLRVVMEKGQSTIERYLNMLKKNGLIEFRGAPRSGGYYIKEGK